jgi:hypothetical protein
MTPDEFNESARTWVILALRDHAKLGAAVNFTEGYEFASSIALKMTDIYRRAVPDTTRRS